MIISLFESQKNKIASNIVFKSAKGNLNKPADENKLSENGSGISKKTVLAASSLVTALVIGGLIYSKRARLKNPIVKPHVDIPHKNSQNSEFKQNSKSNATKLLTYEPQNLASSDDINKSTSKIQAEVVDVLTSSENKTNNPQQQRIIIDLTAIKKKKEDDIIDVDFTVTSGPSARNNEDIEEKSSKKAEIFTILSEWFEEIHNTKRSSSSKFNAPHSSANINKKTTTRSETVQDDKIFYEDVDVFVEHLSEYDDIFVNSGMFNGARHNYNHPLSREDNLEIFPFGKSSNTDFGTNDASPWDDDFDSDIWNSDLPPFDDTFGF